MNQNAHCMVMSTPIKCQNSRSTLQIHGDQGFLQGRVDWCCTYVEVVNKILTKAINAGDTDTGKQTICSGIDKLLCDH